MDSSDVLKAIEREEAARIVRFGGFPSSAARQVDEEVAVLRRDEPHFDVWDRHRSDLLRAVEVGLVVPTGVVLVRE